MARKTGKRRGQRVKPGQRIKIRGYTVKGHTRKQGRLPPRTKGGRFKRKGGGQGRLF